MADNINISPEMINNIMNMLKNSSDNNKNNNSDNSDNNINNITSNFSSQKDSNNTESSSIDMETILKIKSIMEKINSKNDPRSNLLYSLKPYLRSSKRSKLDQYANLLKITQVTGLFNNEKGDQN